jgi:hypothetical protein
MRYLILTAALLFIIMTGFSEGAGKKMSEVGNRHNFSYSNISANFRAVPGGDVQGYDRSSQICVFCHTPHRASGEGPLWNRAASGRTFKHFSSSTLAIDDAALKAAADYGQPTGSSRLCLSCHDGVTALGAVFTTPNVLDNAQVNINFTNKRTGLTGPNVAIGYETYSTHHPVSFNYSQTVINLLRAPPYNKTEYWWNPSASNDVKLDKLGRMQCMTCHDPHQDKSNVPGPTTPLWTAKTYAEVCLTCHNIVRTYPW